MYTLGSYAERRCSTNRSPRAGILILTASISIEQVGHHCNLPAHNGFSAFIPSFARTLLACPVPNVDDVLARYDFLTQRLVCQEVAIAMVRNLLRYKMKNIDSKFFVHFYGLKGVGKTMLAQLISRAISFDDNPLYRGAGFVRLRFVRARS